jgi:hypothetical protein
MDPRSVLIVQALTNLVSYALLMIWFVYPRLRPLPVHVALQPLVAFHWIRTLGLFALMPDFAGAYTASSRWAHHVAIGDLTTVLLAMVAVAALRKRHPFAIPAVWLFNVIGLLDIINAGINARADRILDHGVGAQALVIAFGPPALLVTHVTIFVLLIGGRRTVQATVEGMQ